MKGRADFIARTFEELGISLNPTSRLGKQIDFYLDRKGILPQFIETDHPLFQTGVEAFRDLNQVAFALKQLLPIRPKDEIKNQLRRLITDNVLPQDNPNRSPGRDAQVELFVAGLCARAQLDPIFDESPDLRCKLFGQTLGVAIKRIKAPPERFEERFEQRIREAIEQIERSGIPGVIAADVSQSLNPTNWRVPIEVSDSRFDVLWEAEMDKLKNRFGMRLIEWARGTNARGVILINHILRCTPTKNWRMELFGASLNFSPFNQRRRREFESFDAELKRAICNPGEVRLATANE